MSGFFLVQAQGEFDAINAQGFYLFLLFIVVPIAVMVAIGLTIAGGGRRLPRCAHCGRILDRGVFRCPVCHPDRDMAADLGSDDPSTGDATTPKANGTGRSPDDG